MGIQWVHLQLLEALKLLDSAGRGKHLCTHTVHVPQVSDPGGLDAGNTPFLSTFKTAGFLLPFNVRAGQEPPHSQ